MFKILRILLFSPVFVSNPVFSAPYLQEYISNHAIGNDESGEPDGDLLSLGASSLIDPNYNFTYFNPQLISIDNPLNNHSFDISPDETSYVEKNNYLEKGTYLERGNYLEKGNYFEKNNHVEKSDFSEESNSNSRELSGMQYLSGFARLTTINVPEPASVLLTVIGGLALLLSRRIKARK